MAKQTLWQRIKGFFSGKSGGGGNSGGSSKATARRASAIRQKNTGGGSARVAVYRSLRRRDDEEDERPRYKSMAEATKTASKPSGIAHAIDAKIDKLSEKSKSAPIDPKESIRKASQEKARERLKKIGKAAESNLLNESEQKLLRDAKKERKEYHEATGHRYDVNEKGISKEEQTKRRQAQKMNSYDVEREKFETEKHPIAMSAARGAASGVTFGGSELLAQKSKARKESGAEEFYQTHKNKTAETIGEIGGSLASFGATAGATEKLATKVGGKAIERGAERLASGKVVQNAAKRSVNKAVKKGLVKEGSEELIKQVGKEKAKKVASALGTDIVQNLTTGALYDVNKASAEHKVGSSDWWKELGKSAALNAAITGGVAGVSAVRGGKGLAVETARKLDLQKGLRELADSRAGAVRNLPRVSDSLDELTDVSTRARRNAPRIGESLDDRIARINAENPATRGEVRIGEADDAIDVVNPNARRNSTVEIGAADEGIDVINPNARRAAQNADEVVEEAAKATQSPANEAIPEAAESTAKKATKESAEKKAKESAQMSFENTGKAAEDSADDSVQMSWEDAVKASEERKAAQSTAGDATEKAKKPKTKKQQKKEEAEHRKFFDDMRNKEKEMASDVRSQTKGEYSYRQGEHTAAEHAPVEEAKRIKNQQDEVYKKIKDGDIREMFTDTNSPFGIFKTANKAEMRKAADEAVSRLNNGDPMEIAERLFEKAERMRKDLTSKSALSSVEHATLDDIADIVALRNWADSYQTKLPAKYEEAFTHVIEWQRTEAAQMLKSVDIFLKENDQAYRRMFIARDVDKYLRKVIGADDAAIADIKRSLDANHGAGYYDKMIDALSEFKGSKNEAAFRKAYADFQAEIFMNTKPTVWDTVNLWRHAFMLSSPKTGANNIIGNLMQRTMYRISDAVNIAGENIAQGINPNVKRTTALLKSSDQRKLAAMYTSGRRGKLNLKNANYLKGFDDQAFADTINMVSDADVGEMMESSKYMGDVIKGLNYQPTTVGGKAKKGALKLGKYGNEYVSVMLNEPDSWFVERNYRTTLLKYLEANGINSSKSLNTKEGEKLLKEARAYAKDVALENTYKKANNVVSFLEGIRRKGHTKGSNAGYKAGAILLDAELPYLKVPANLIINNFKYSPLGAMKGSVDAFRGVVKGDAELLNKATRELSKGLTGTGMAALGYMMFCKDQTDDDSWGFIGNAKDELKEYGVRDNSFKIGDHNFSIANMGIGSVQFLMGASLAEDLAEKGQTPPHQIVIDSLSKTVDTVADMSLMENAVSLLDAFGNGGDYNATVSDRLGNASMEVAGDLAAQFVPNPLRGVAKGMTDADLDTGVKKSEDRSKVQRVLDRNINNFVQGVPVLNEKVLPHKVDTHGNLVGERRTTGEKAEAILNNVLNPLSPKKVNIPEADKEELKVKDEDGKSFKPQGFDPDRKYEAGVGVGQRKETISLTGKEREQVARAAKNSGYDMANVLVQKGMFGDRLGDRAQSILSTIPDDEEKAREMLFSTDEWKNASNEQKHKWLEAMYGQGQGNGGKGVKRTRNQEAYVNIAGHSEGDFRYQNDLHWQYQKKYEENNLAEAGIDKGTYADVVQAMYDANHKWDEEKGNVDTPNSAKKVKAGILSVEGLTPEQRVLIYQSIRGKRNGFGWNDWDGVSSGGGGYYRRGYGYRRRSGGGKSKVPTINAKSMASATKSVKGTSVKLTPPTPKTKVAAPKFKKYEV